jgi:hypothetical protein
MNSTHYHSFLPNITAIYEAIMEKDISHSVLSYAKIYLVLALYFIKFEDEVSVKNAELCFLHYKNLIDGNTRNIDDEKLFYQMLGKDGKDEEKFGRQRFQEIQERYQLKTISSIGRRTTKMMQEMMTHPDNYDSQNSINTLLEEEIAKKLFYNLCTINVTGN